MDDNPNLKCYAMLINNNTLHNNTILPLIITNYSDQKICRPEKITVDISEKISENKFHKWNYPQ